MRDSTSNEDAVVSEEGGRAAVPFEQDENKILLILTLVIGAVVGMVVVAFMLVTENLGRRLYPAGGASWRRLAMPVFGSLVSGYFLARYFPYARGSGIPQTKTALFLHDGYIRFRTVIGKFSMCSLTLASGIALGREGPSVQVAAGIASKDVAVIRRPDGTDQVTYEGKPLYLYSAEKGIFPFRGGPPQVSGTAGNGNGLAGPAGGKFSLIYAG